MVLLSPLIALAFREEPPAPKIDLSPAAVQRGEALFFENCNQCHGLKYLRTKGHPDGIAPRIPPQGAKASFGAVPPDLSTMAIAQGKRLNGVRYIYRLLTTYHPDEKGQVVNKAFAEKTHTEGRTAMPQPIPDSDPELPRKAMDISVFLLNIAEPADRESKSMGAYVLGYMTVLTVILYSLNRLVWKGLRKDC